MQTSNEITELASALAKAQGEFPTVKTDSTAKIQTKTGSEYSYTYTSLAAIFEAITPALKANGLALLQFPETAEGMLILTTRLLHSSGQWADSVMSLAVNTSDIKALGSAITYARRYAVQAILRLASEDDDGDSAGKVRPQSRPAPADAQPQPGGDAQRSDWCALHNCQMSEHSKTKPDGTVERWFSHRLPDGTWCNGGKPKAAAPTQVTVESGAHWIDDPATRAKFWAWARGERGLSDEQVYEALGVTNIHSYVGTAKAACEQIAAKYPKQAVAVDSDTDEESVMY